MFENSRAAVYCNRSIIQYSTGTSSTLQNTFIVYKLVLWYTLGVIMFTYIHILEFLILCKQCSTIKFKHKINHINVVYWCHETMRNVHNCFFHFIKLLYSLFIRLKWWDMSYIPEEIYWSKNFLCIVNFASCMVSIFNNLNWHLWYDRPSLYQSDCSIRVFSVCGKYSAMTILNTLIEQSLQFHFENCIFTFKGASYIHYIVFFLVCSFKGILKHLLCTTPACFSTFSIYYGPNSSWKFLIFSVLVCICNTTDGYGIRLALFYPFLLTMLALLIPNTTVCNYVESTICSCADHGNHTCMIAVCWGSIAYCTFPTLHLIITGLLIRFFQSTVCKLHNTVHHTSICVFSVIW